MTGACPFPLWTTAMTEVFLRNCYHRWFWTLRSTCLSLTVKNDCESKPIPSYPACSSSTPHLPAFVCRRMVCTLAWFPWSSRRSTCRTSCAASQQDRRSAQCWWARWITWCGRPWPSCAWLRASSWRTWPRCRCPCALSLCSWARRTLAWTTMKWVAPSPPSCQTRYWSVCCEMLCLHAMSMKWVVAPSPFSCQTRSAVKCSVSMLMWMKWVCSCEWSGSLHLCPHVKPGTGLSAMKYSVSLVCFVGLSTVKWVTLCPPSCQTRYSSVCYERLCLHVHLRPCIGLFRMFLLTSTMSEVGCSISTSILNMVLVCLLWNIALSLCLLQFTARWYLCVWESRYVLLPISQKCPQHCLWNSSSSGLTLWCLSSQFIHRHYFPAFLQYKAHTHACTHTHTHTNKHTNTQQHPITSHVTVFHIHLMCLKCCP